MATLTALGASNGYVAGVNSLDTSGYVAVIPAFQKIYFACGKAYDEWGYAKLDFVNTKLTGDASGAFEVGEVITQATSGAEGIYGECIDIKLTGTPSAAFTIGELVTQASSNAKGYVAYSAAGAIYVYPLTHTLSTPLEFTTAQVVTGATSGSTITPSAVSSWYSYNVSPTASTASVGYNHFVYRTTTTEFDTSNTITGDKSGSTLTPAAVTAPPHWLPWILVDGVFPDGGSNIGCLAFNRVWLNSMLNPHQWFCSRSFEPLDFESGYNDIGRATYGQTAEKAGVVGDPIIATIPYKDRYLIWGCADEINILTGDPLAGGTQRCISKATGIFSPTSYCWDDKNNLYFMGVDGIYRLTSEAIINAQPPENITKQRIPKLISSVGLNRRTDRVAMGYDKKRYGIEVCVTQQDGEWSVNWWMDLRTGGLFPDVFADYQAAASMSYFDSHKSSERHLLLGGYDGYIRKFDESEKTDQGNNTIESYYCIGPFVADGEPRNTVDIRETSLTTGEETDSVTVDFHRKKSADEVISDVIDGATPDISKSLSGDGLANSIAKKISGRAIAIKVKNANSEESFSMESVDLDIKIDGKQK